MTSREYDDYCRVNRLLHNMRYADLVVLSYAITFTLNEENNLYFKEALYRLKPEVETLIASCAVD